MYAMSFLLHAFSDSLIRMNKIAREGNRDSGLACLANSSHDSEIPDFLRCLFPGKK